MFLEISNHKYNKNFSNINYQYINMVEITWYKSCDRSHRNQHFCIVKTFFYTFALLLAVTAATTARSQTRSTPSIIELDSVFVSERIENNYRVKTYRIKSDGDADYEVRYRINLAALNDSLGNNSEELAALDAFLRGLQSDSLTSRARATITGYASPDGPHAFNASLAKRRADDFRSYLDRRYNLSQRFDVTTSSVAEDWAECREMVSTSNIPDRTRVLDIIDSDRSDESKEQALRGMASPWSYLKRDILPALRRVEVVIAYKADQIVEVRERIAAPAPVIVATAPERCCTVVDEDITGIIVEVPERIVRHEARDIRHSLRHLAQNERKKR